MINEIKKIPVLALRGLNIFPYMDITLDVRRNISVNAVEFAVQKDQLVFITAQKDSGVDMPDFNDLYETGVIAKIKQVLKLPKGNIRVLVNGIQIARLDSVESDKEFLMANVVEIVKEKKSKETKNINAMKRRISDLFYEYCTIYAHIETEIFMKINDEINDSEKFSYLVASNINAPLYERQAILTESNLYKRLRKIISLLISETEIIKLADSIQDKVKSRIDKNQKEYFLREQIKVIQGELGENEDITIEAAEYIKKLSCLSLSDDIEEKILKEINRFQLMPAGSHEATVVRTYLDTFFELPWNKKTKENINLKKCKNILEKDHYGLTDVKERILEYLAVKSEGGNKSGMVLCLVGPPGVGKTSVVSSIAKAVGRKFQRISLGGVRDESDIRGHRKTYIGAMPGRIINAMKLADSSNPLILLDEIDKMASDFRGDPSSALLEVLDKEQNGKFRDHYLEVPFDLSDVMFITTANTTETIPSPLLDRLEVIELSGYTYFEKEKIAAKYLIKKQLKEHGIDNNRLKITNKAVSEIINYYTMEAGVRTLDRQIAAIIRKALYNSKINGKDFAKIDKKDIESLLGPRKYLDQTDTNIKEPGIATGLAYTSYGGCLLNIEVNVLNGDGKTELTGKLGDVMKESALAAICYIRSKTEKLGIDSDFYKTKDIHIHFPEGAVPKDGPSAGITMATAVVSALTNVPIRSDVAMTGEITIRGRVLAIGGLKEKSLAAHRAKIKNIIIPYDNLSDISKIPKEIVNDFNFIPVKSMEEVLDFALIKEK